MIESKVFLNGIIEDDVFKRFVSNANYFFCYVKQQLRVKQWFIYKFIS